MIRRLIKRPIFFVAAAVLGFVVLFPKFGPRETSFLVRVPSCADELTIAAYSGGQLVRRHQRVLRGESFAMHSFELPSGDYRLRVEVACSGGRESGEVERTHTVEENAELELDLTKKCTCAPRT